MRVKQAEADAEANILHGRGIAGQRKKLSKDSPIQWKR